MPGHATKLLIHFSPMCSWYCSFLKLSRPWSQLEVDSITEKSCHWTNFSLQATKRRLYEALSFCFRTRKESPLGPRVDFWYTVTGEERAVGQAVGVIANWCVIRSVPDYQWRCRSCAGRQTSDHVLIIPAQPTSEQAEGYHHLSPHFSFPRSKVDICVRSSHRKHPGNRLSVVLFMNWARPNCALYASGIPKCSGPVQNASETPLNSCDTRQADVETALGASVTKN